MYTMGDVYLVADEKVEAGVGVAAGIFVNCRLDCVV